eukprot:SAG11_NODE_421_length_9620_cov_10.014809_6_plen_160_part_00
MKYQQNATNRMLDFGDDSLEGRHPYRLRPRERDNKVFSKRRRDVEDFNFLYARVPSGSGFWQSFHSALGTSVILSSSRHQRTNGSVERAIAYVTECMRMSISYKQDNWSSLLPQVQFSINSSVAASTEMSPFYMEKGRNPIMMVDFLTPPMQKTASSAS